MRRLAIVWVTALGCATAPQPQPTPAPAPITAASPTTPVEPAPTVVPAMAVKASVALEASPAAKASVAPKADVAPTPDVVPQADVAPAVEVASKPPPVARRKDGRFEVLILGDSMAATDFGRALEKKLARHKKIRVSRRGKSATGLARPDFFDWMNEGEARAKRSQPDLVIVVLGGNDGQDLIDKEKKKRRVIWGSDQWADAYAERVTAFIGAVAAPERRVLWLALPIMDYPSLEKKLTTIREVQRTALAPLAPAVQYVETREHFYAGDMLLKTVGVRGYKRPQKLRQKDGIHFSVPGSRYFADKIAPVVLEALGLR